MKLQVNLKLKLDKISVKKNLKSPHTYQRHIYYFIFETNRCTNMKRNTNKNSCGSFIIV